MRVIPKRTFLLRQSNGKDIVARRGEVIDVSDAELKNFKKDFSDLPTSKK